MNSSTVTNAKEVSSQPVTELQFADLLTSQLQGVDNTEVVISITTVPSHTRLPMHWHPGEEFAYVLEGSLTLHQEDKPDEHYRKGDVGIVPLKQVHTISTGEESTRVLVFRVHESGQPGRILAD